MPCEIQILLTGYMQNFRFFYALEKAFTGIIFQIVIHRIPEVCQLPLRSLGTVTKNMYQIYAGWFVAQMEDL